MLIVLPGNVKERVVLCVLRLNTMKFASSWYFLRECYWYFEVCCNLLC